MVWPSDCERHIRVRLWATRLLRVAMRTSVITMVAMLPTRTMLPFRTTMSHWTAMAFWAVVSVWSMVSVWAVMRRGTMMSLGSAMANVGRPCRMMSVTDWRLSAVRGMVSAMMSVMSMLPMVSVAPVMGRRSVVSVSSAMVREMPGVRAVATRPLMASEVMRTGVWTMTMSKVVSAARPTMSDVTMATVMSAMMGESPMATMLTAMGRVPVSTVKSVMGNMAVVSRMSAALPGLAVVSSMMRYMTMSTA